MANERSEKSPYPSLYSPGGWVSGAQYIIELVCENKAALEKKDLPVRFWKLKEWEVYFKRQTRRCHQLLKKYDEVAIIQALKSYKGKRVYSLMAPQLEQLIKEQQAIVDAKKAKQASAKPVERATNTNIRKPQAKSNIISRLKELE